MRSVHELPVEERTDFPRAGARARQWRRFEDALHGWLETSEGRFVTWCAQRQLEAAAPDTPIRLS
jgi:hypothetical protein